LELDAYTLHSLEQLKQDSNNDITANANLYGKTLTKLSYSDNKELLLPDLMQGDVWTNAAATKTNFINHARNVS